jgi:competence protein ComEC
MPLLWLSLAFLCGIVISQSITMPIIGWCALGMIALIPLLPPTRKLFNSWIVQLPHPIQISVIMFYPLLLISLALGAIRYQLAQPKFDPRFIAYYNDQGTEATIEGLVCSPPDVRDTYTNLRIRVEQLATAPQGAEGAQFQLVHGLLLARVGNPNSYQYGDLVRLQGKIVTPSVSEDFSYRDYLTHQGIFSTIGYPKTSLIKSEQGNLVYAAIYALRQRALNLVYAFYPDPEAGLMAGILLGVEAGIPQEVQEAFRQTGTSHIIVISGFNITIIAALFTAIFGKLLGMRKGFIASIAGIIFYTLLVGANPAVLRAAILGLMALLGSQLGRRQAGLNSLAFVAAVMAVITPMVLWDVSFQLSFAATLGIMLYAEPATQWFTNLAGKFTTPEKANRLAGPVGEFFLLTLAAQLTTLPVMIYYFKRISLTSLLANPLILPAQPPLMVLGGLSVLAGMVLRPLGQLLAWVAWPFTAYTIRVVEWMATVPHGSIVLGQVALPMIVLFYAILLSLTFFHSRLLPTLKRLTPAIPLVGLGLLTILAWKAAFYAPDGKLHMTILDVGTGEAILVQSPGGRNVLINGGPSTIALSDAMGRRLSPFDRSLDWLMVADIDDEDIVGIPGNLERFMPEGVLWAGNPSGTRAMADLQTQLNTLGVPITTAVAGQSLDLGSGARLRVLSTDVRGAVLLVEWENFRMLLPMGMDFEAMEDLINSSAMRSLSALVLPESGYAPLNPPELFANLSPQLAVLSVAPGDRSGLPSPETLEALEGYNLLRTDQNGWIEISTDGKQMWVEVERK